MTTPEEKVEQSLKSPREAPSGPAPKHANYLLVFVALAVLTGIEIVVAQLPVPRAPILVPLAAIKVSLVALFYMHLRHDSKLFSAIFAAGILLALVFVTAMLIIFGWHVPAATNGLAMPSMTMP